MYAQLGEILFQTQISPENISHEISVNFAEHAKIEGKPRLQAIGDNLDEIKMTIKFHIAFCDPSEEFAALLNYQQDLEVLPFILGTGEVIGNFVIVSLSKKIIQMATDGNIMDMDIDISLREYVTDDLLAEKKKQKAAKAPALRDPTVPQTVKPNKLQLGLIRAQVSADIKYASLHVSKSVSEAKGMESKISRARQTALNIQKTLKDVQKTVNKINSRMQELKNYIDTYRSAYNNFQQIINNINNLQQNVINMSTAVSTGDIDTVWAANNNFQFSVNNMATSSASVITKACTRLPIPKG